MKRYPGPRTYNQVRVPRKYTPGKPRFSIYWTWSYPWEANRDVTELDNRFSTMTEVRRVAWPEYETLEYSAKMFLQGIAGTLELFHLGLIRFQQAVGEITGQPVAVYQRIDQAGQKQQLDHGVLDDTDTLMVFGLDHMVTEQEAAPEEIEAIRDFLAREGTRLILGPHHDVGATNDLKQRAMEYAHHGDALVPSQQRFGRYTRSLMKGLGLPVENRWGLHPATIQGTTTLQPLITSNDLDTRGWLEGVKTFNFHARSSTYSRGSRSTCRTRTPSRRRATATSTCSCGCRLWPNGRATYCSPTRRSSRRSSAATRASTASGRTSRRGELEPLKRRRPLRFSPRPRRAESIAACIPGRT